MTSSALSRPHPLVTKLELFDTLSADDKAAIERASGMRVRHVAPRADVIREGDCPDHIHLVLKGWACRYKQLKDGRRQILGFLLPGDFCDLRNFILKRMDHSIASLTSVTLAEIPRDTILEMTDNGSRLSRAMWWSALVCESIEREWIVNLGQRTALERMGHLLCELFVRQRAVGLSRGNSCDQPLTQLELAETTGLSTVHVNRTLQELRAQGLITLQGKTLTIPDLARLERTSLFNANYLHLDKGGIEFNAIDTEGRA